MFILPTHPRTGLRAIGIINGRPVWPVIGASEPVPEKPAEAEPEPKSEPKPEPTQEPSDEVARLRDELAKAKKWEQRAKENFEKAQKFDQLEAANATELEKAQKQAEDEAARAQAATLRAVRSEVKSMADKFIDREDAVLRLGDLTRFVGEDGEIDEKAIGAALDEVLKAAPHLEKKAEDPKPDPKPGARPTERLKPGAVPNAEERPKTLAEAVAAHYQT